MTAYVIQSTFGRGELSPRLHARVDIEHWRMGLAQCINWIVLRQGGLRRRPGTRYQGRAKLQGAADTIRLAKFEFSALQSYVLELGHLYMRLWAQNGQVVTGGSPYEVATPWTADQVRHIQFAQSGDVLYAVHPLHRPRKISRLAETNWTVTPVALEDGPYLSLNATATSLKPDTTGRLTPKMATNALPSGVVSSSGEVAGFEAFRAFDQTDAWFKTASSTPPHYLQYQFGAPKIVTGYSLQSSYATQSAPRTWTFAGSNDGTTWTTLDTRAGQTGWGVLESRFYTFRNSLTFTFYRLTVTAVNDAPSSVQPLEIAEIGFQGGGADAVTVVLTASSTAGINGGQGFLVGDIGRHIRFLSEAAHWHWFEIVGVASATAISTKIKSPPLPSNAQSTNWRLGAFSATSGYPSAVSFFGERLVYGGTSGQPQTVWGSRTGSFDDFGISTPLQADDAFSFTFGAVGPIQWLAESSDLLIGTVSAVRSLGPADRSEGFSATNVAQGRPVMLGAEPIQPILAGVPVFVGRFGRALHELVYSSDSGGYIAPDISVLSEHIPKAGIASVGFSARPNALLWMAMTDGSLAAVTYEREQNMAAWHRHTLGGGGKVESLVAAPGVERDEIWLLVSRSIPNGGGTLRTVERFAPDFEGVAPSEAYYVDCGLSYSGGATATVTGLDHLNGFTVVALADGGTERPAVVTGGSYTLPSSNPAAAIHVGLAYDEQTLARTLPVSQGLGDGSGLGRKKRIKKLFANTMETGGLRVRSSSSRKWEELALRSAGATMDEANPLLTGDSKITVDGSWNDNGVLEFRASGPQPATIRAITPMFDAEP